MVGGGKVKIIKMCMKFPNNEIKRKSVWEFMASPLWKTGIDLSAAAGIDG